MHLISYILSNKDDQFIKKLLSNPFWIIPNKLYYSFILLLNPVILYVLFHSETRIALNVGNCILYSLICGFISFVLSCIVYIIFERPGAILMKIWLDDTGEKKKVL